jgi:thiamine pyrophosphokinase
MRTFLVAGSPTANRPAGLEPGPEDRVIAADSGAVHARAWGWPIHLLIGDMDSLPLGDARVLAAAGTQIFTAPPVKDETDLELALAHALAWGSREIVICAALGGRADHMLANVLQLARSELSDVDACLADGLQVLRVLHAKTNVGVGPGARQERARLLLCGMPGDLLSLLPIGGDATGVWTEGLAYPLRGETLYLGQARGVSNVFEEASARVDLETGILLVIHTKS